MYKTSCCILATLLVNGAIGLASPQIPDRFDESSQAPVVELARDGEILLPIIAPSGNREVITQAERFSQALGRIVGSESPEVLQTEEDEDLPASGIFLRLADEFSDEELPRESFFHPSDSRQRENYLLLTDSQGLHLIGATPLALSHAVADLLHRIGYRRFFPAPVWEIWPDSPNLEVSLRVGERPDFHQRFMAYGGGTWRYNHGNFQDWRVANRMASGLVLRTTHSYQTIMRQNLEFLNENPEFFAEINGERKWLGDRTKFNFAHPGLEDFVYEWTVNAVRRNRDQDSISLDPSDGDAWCQNPDSIALGSVSDQVLGLTNSIAERLQEEFPGILVGQLAYGSYSPPPTIRVHPNVVVTITNGFLRGGYTFNELIQKWGAQGATLGAYDYWSVFQWDRDLPGAARAGRPSHWARFIPFIHSEGVRFFTAEASDNWGPYGLGYYIMSRILWDVSEGERIDELREEFLQLAFGPANEPMRRFYELVVRQHRPLLSEDLVGRLYRELETALEFALATGDELVEKRLLDLALYVRYLELYREYSSQRDAPRMEAFTAKMRHVYRMRETNLVQTKQFFTQYMAGLDRSLELDRSWNLARFAPDEDNPFYDPAPFTRAEILGFVRDGVSSNQLLDFEVVEFSRDLVPSSRLGLDLEGYAPGDWGRWITQREMTYYTWQEKANESIPLEVTGGRIATFRNRGNVRLTLFAEEETLLEPVARDQSVPPTGEPFEVTLDSPYQGLHWLNVQVGGDPATVDRKDDAPWSIRASEDEPTSFNYHIRGVYFYVPKGTQVIGGFRSQPLGFILNRKGEVLFDFSSMDSAGYFSFPLPEGEDHQFLFFGRGSGQLLLMTVPPYFARHPDKLMIPREIFESEFIERSLP